MTAASFQWDANHRCRDTLTPESLLAIRLVGFILEMNPHFAAGQSEHICNVPGYSTVTRKQAMQSRVNDER